MYRRDGDQQGRGSAAAAVLCLLLLIISSENTAVQAAAAVYSIDWSFSPKVINPLANGKTFRAGDTLLFKYSPGFHNVVEVDKATYDKCGTPPAKAKVYASGSDRVTLTKGQHYFICSFAGHCKAGMKISIFAA
ncbi:unnamed protein product [Cuscuta campestris]|nr:unnamed protein product [Cuscuta campestris]